MPSPRAGQSPIHLLIGRAHADWKSNFGKISKNSKMRDRRFISKLMASGQNERERAARHNASLP